MQKMFLTVKTYGKLYVSNLQENAKQQIPSFYQKETKLGKVAWKSTLSGYVRYLGKTSNLKRQLLRWQRLLWVNWFLKRLRTGGKN